MYTFGSGDNLPFKFFSTAIDSLMINMINLIIRDLKVDESPICYLNTITRDYNKASYKYYYDNSRQLLMGQH